MECRILWGYVELEDYSIHFICSTPESGIAGRAAIAGIVLIDLDELWTLIPE